MPRAKEDAVKDPRRPLILGDAHSLTLIISKLFTYIFKDIEYNISYVNLTSGSRASSCESHEESSNVQHGFVFAKVSESGDQEAGNEDKVMSNQRLLPSIVLHWFVDE